MWETSPSVSSTILDCPLSQRAGSSFECSNIVSPRRVRMWQYRQLTAVHRVNRPARPEKARHHGFRSKQEARESPVTLIYQQRKKQHKPRQGLGLEGAGISRGGNGSDETLIELLLQDLADINGSY
ncbi:hypothetical protein PRIPAC_83599 [Pristionchus pacificus]|uniref:Ribosomal protein L15 n=1 Tax=Pristionchus pacificus TaxID=54126 RepID=A0A2A6CEL2_PRIPA|nr:hypothetical protein PRIPAC_83599 [Pristionchus pacificus]|eukprot:PDM76642.1 ribosomal protein [Pristionchus pacificus]